MTISTPIIGGEEPPRGNAHDVSERGRAIMHRLKAHAAAKGLPTPDLTNDLDLRRRIYKAARRLEDARARRGDTRPFLVDEEPAVAAFLNLLEGDIAAGNVQPAGPLFARMQGLVGDMRVDLDAPLPDDDEDDA
ncbi:hypothetical protein [Azospirillum argentinense]|uniref:Uncharacterized protein n=1 Tax=Azospirillum brasilense TaxID=192 RepID=A0A4D8QKU9_AZOBR|nr:hypothetical protein [Azospirillum argentinense]QCO07479.1 hypothetical protein D3867_36970 [Azospirillum argentinense]